MIPCRLLPLPLLLAAALPLIALPCLARDCDGAYYRVDASGNELRVARPNPAFSRLLTAARAGEAQAQRSLAVSYETGYQVSRCPATALYWYRQAAQSGDAVARDWLRQNDDLARLHAAGECSATHCAGVSGTARVVTLHPDARRGNHYFARVTINGYSAEGMIDTGASTLAMSADMAKRFGLATANASKGTAATANGNITTANVVVPQVEVAGIKLNDVAVSVGVSGEMLIGMSFLRRLNMTMGDGVLTLRQP